METNSTLRDFLTESLFRGLQLPTAGILLVSVALFLFSALATGETRVSGEITTGILWLCIGASGVLPVLIVANTTYDVLSWFREGSKATEQTHSKSVINYVFRATELGLAAVIFTVIVSFGYLVTTQPGGEGAGGISVGVVLTVVITSILLSIIVLVRGVVDYVRFSTGYA